MGPWRLATVSLAVLTTFAATSADVAGAAAPASAPAGSDASVTGYSCDGVYRGAHSGTVIETTSAGPNGSTVTPGQRITVTLTWNPGDFGGGTTSKSGECVEIGRQISHGLSREHSPAPSGGTDTFDYVVPLEGTAGQSLCGRGVVSGPDARTEKSRVVCYSVLGAATPEVPNVLLLPLAAGLVMGAVVLVARRSRRAGRVDQRAEV